MLVEFTGTGETPFMWICQIADIGKGSFRRFIDWNVVERNEARVNEVLL